MTLGLPMALLHMALSLASLGLTPSSRMSAATVCCHVFRGRPTGFGPSTAIFVQLFTQSVSSFLSTWPNHLSLLLLMTSLMGSLMGFSGPHMAVSSPAIYHTSISASSSLSFPSSAHGQHPWPMSRSRMPYSSSHMRCTPGPSSSEVAPWMSIRVPAL